MKTPNTILVVDDDPSGRAMLSLSLRQAGFSVLTAPSGEKALEILGKNHCDWLVTDARMEPMDGFALSDKAKLLQPDLRVVMVSAIYGQRDIDGHAIERLFPKPVHIDELVHFMAAPQA